MRTINRKRAEPQRDHTSKETSTGKHRPDPPLERPVSRGTRVILVVFALLTVLATNQLFVLAGHTDKWFAWTIQPPLTAAFLGSGYAAGCVLVVLALRTRLWAEARAAIVTIGLFAALTLVATLLHLDRFHFDSPGLVARFAAWFWLFIYVVVPVALLVLSTRQQLSPGADPEHRRPMPRWLGVVLALQGAVLLAVGITLFVAPGTAQTLWAWPLTPLTAQMVAAWLIAFGFAAGIALVERDLERLRIDTIGYTVFGLLQLLALVVYGRQVVRWGTAAATGYLVFLCTVPLVGITGWWLVSRGRARSRR